VHSIGILASLAAAFFWAVAIILFKKSGDTISPLALNLFKCLLTLVLLVATLFFSGVPLFPTAPLNTWLLFAVSGIMGISLADTFLFMALTRIGAGMTAVVECLYLPLTLLLSFLFLNESLGMKGICGAALVIGAIFMASAPFGKHDQNRNGSALRPLLGGLFFGIVSMLLIAASIVMIKHQLEKTDVLWVSFVRVLFGTAGLLVAALLTGNRRSLFVQLIPSRAWLTALPGAFIGNYLAMLAWLAGMKYALVSVAAIVNQLSTIFIFLLGAVFLREPVTASRILATLMAVCGAVLASGVTF